MKLTKGGNLEAVFGRIIFFPLNFYFLSYWYKSINLLISSIIKKKYGVLLHPYCSCEWACVVTTKRFVKLLALKKLYTQFFKDKSKKKLCMCMKWNVPKILQCFLSIFPVCITEEENLMRERVRRLHSHKIQKEQNWIWDQ